MEDSHFLDMAFGGKDWVFGGVYDGHSGDYAARYTAERLHRIFLEALLSGVSPQEAFVASYEKTSEELKVQRSGTTAVDFFIREGKIYAANVGDARAIVIGDKMIHRLTVDHRLENAEERQRIESMGGYIEYPYTYRGVEGLMPTRTIGDEYFKPVGIIATPSVSEYAITEDDFMLVAACDGLFDFMTNEEVAEFAREFRQPEMLVEALKRQVLINRLGTDNLTIIAVSLRESPPTTG